MTEWENACVICASHGRQTRLDHGHVCARCATTLTAALNDIQRLATDAAAWITPGSAQGGHGKPAYGSKPPCNVAALDPENTPVPRFNGQRHAPTVLEVLEGWEREIREARGYAPYGEASSQRAALGQATLTGCITFLASQIDWLTTTPDIGVEDFAGEIADCVRALRRWDVEAEHQGSIVRCPTITDDGPCGARLHVHTWAALDHDHSTGETVTCRKCGVRREPAQLLHAAGADDIYVDAQALAEHFGIRENLVRLWGSRGKVRKRGNLYRWGDVAKIRAEVGA